MSRSGLGVVVVGTGFGCRVHVPAARAAGLEVTAVVGRDRDRAARRGSRVGVETACASLDEALRLARADIVVIATPPATHAEVAEQAIAAGRHVLVEKPFTMTTDEARRLVRLAAAAGVTALVGHEFRFSPGRVAMYQALREERIGPPRLGSFISHSAFVAPTDIRLPPWWFDRASGGGWLGAAVSHIIDAIRLWLGEFDTVSAALGVVSDRDDATHAEDTVGARFRMRSGCEAVLQQTAGTWGENAELVRIAGPHGTLALGDDAVTFSDASGSRRLEPSGPRTSLDVDPSDDPQHQFTHLELGPAIVQLEILRDLALGVPPSYDIVPPATFADGLASVAVMDAMRRSAAADGAVVAVAVDS